MPPCLFLLPRLGDVRIASWGVSHSESLQLLSVLHLQCYNCYPELDKYFQLVSAKMHSAQTPTSQAQASFVLLLNSCSKLTYLADLYSHIYLFIYAVPPYGNARWQAFHVFNSLTQSTNKMPLHSII